MDSLYDALFDDIPLFVVPGTEDSDVIEYETHEQRNARLLKQIHEHSLSDWNVNRMIRDEIDKRVKQLWAECESKARAVAVAAFNDGTAELFSKESK